MEGAGGLPQKRVFTDRSNQPQKRPKIGPSDLERMISDEGRDAFGGRGDQASSAGDQIPTESELGVGKDISFKPPPPPNFDKGKETISPNLPAGVDGASNLSGPVPVGKVKENGLKRKRPQVSAGGHDPVSDLSLIEVVKYHGKLVRQSAKNWVERYEMEPKAALTELLMMLFEACGVQYQADEGPLDEIDVDDVVVSLVNQAKDGNLEDYLGSKQKDLKNFKDNLLVFWDSLVLECQEGPLFDQVFLEKCMDYVIALSCTPPRVFRQVTTLVGLQLVTSLVTVAKTLGGQRETTQRQLNAEKKKRKDGPRVESLNKTLSVTHEKITMAEEMMRKIFTGLFMHRYRDVDPDIRMACIRAIGSWIVLYPSLFLQDLYLKYLGWTLNDKNASVRKTSIIALQNLYEVDDNVPSLGLFTERFCNRMIELADDIDVSVAVSAIGLLKQLLRHQLLADDELGPLYDLLIDESPLIRHAVGELVYDHLIAQKFSSSQPVPKGMDNEGSEFHIGRLLQILREFSADPILSDYVIDAVWEDMKAMKELLDNNRREVTAGMIKNYPQLLRKYLADKAKLSSLVEIIMHMKLELYSLKRQEQNFTTVLQLIKDAFFKHGEGNTLKACVRAITFCASESQADLQDSAQNKLKELEDELVLKLRSAIKQAGVSEDEYSLTVNFRRLYQLQLLKFVSSETLFTDMHSLLKDFNNLDDEVIQLVLMNMYLHVAWCLRSVDTENPSEAAISSLLSKRDNLICQLEYFTDGVLESWAQGTARTLLSCTICIILADLWSLFSEAKLTMTKLQSVGFCPNEAMLQKFWKLCDYRLNAADDEEDEDDTSEHVDEINQKDVVMCAAAKLVAHEMVPKDAPKQLPFLEGGVLQFALKLPLPDVQEILKDVQKRVEGINTDEDPSSWRPYFTFVDYLREKYSRNEGFHGEKEPSTSKHQAFRPKRAKKVKGKKLFEAQDTTDEEDAHSESDHDEPDEEDDDTPLSHAKQSSKSMRLRTIKADTAERSKQNLPKNSSKSFPETRTGPAEMARRESGSAGIGVNVAHDLIASATEEQLPTGLAQQMQSTSIGSREERTSMIGTFGKTGYRNSSAEEHSKATNEYSTEQYVGRTPSSSAEEHSKATEEYSTEQYVGRTTLSSGEDMDDEFVGAKRYRL